MAGPIEVTADDLPAGVLPHTVEQWVELARKQRKDLLAARIEVKVAEGEREKVWAKYVPSLALMGQGKLDNNEAQRFDDDPFSWNVMATLTLNAWDGGIREAELKAVESKLRQAALAVEDLDKRIESEVRAAFQALSDSKASSTLAQRQQELALATQALAKAAEQAGAATGLEVIDANTMVFMSEIQLVTAGIEEGTAILDLRSATGSPLPFGE